MNKYPSRYRYTWLTLLISLQLCVQPLLQGQESATQEKKKAETTPAENQTLPPKSSDGEVPQKEQNEVIEIKTPYGPMKVLKKAGQGPVQGQQAPENAPPTSDTLSAPSSTQTPPPPQEPPLAHRSVLMLPLESRRAPLILRYLPRPRELRPM